VLVREGRKIANDHGIPLFVETHRNNFTETLPQTLQLIDAVSDIRLTADLSHFVVVGEFLRMGGGKGDREARARPGTNFPCTRSYQ